MGGNAFKNKTLSRINKADIVPTVSALANDLNYPKLTIDYITSHFLGSVGKQPDSGDIDIAISDELFSFNDFKNIAYACRNLLGNDNVKTAFKAKQVNTVVPIINSDEFVQLDFIYGNVEWLQFSHYSPGKDKSRWKGVMISQTMGVLAKMKIFYRYPENAIVDKDNGIDERLAEVACAYHLENGLKITSRLRENGGFKPVDYETFESKCPVVPPRVPRLGYITDPDTVIRMIVSEDATREDVSTFEGLLSVLRKRFNDEEWVSFSERLARSLKHSGAKREIEGLALLEYLLKFEPDEKR